MLQSVHPGGPLWNDDFHKSEVGHSPSLHPDSSAGHSCFSPGKSTPTFPQPYIRPSELFGGNPDHYGGFVLQCRLAFYCAPTTYSSDVAKITFVISALKREALRWAHSYLTNSDSKFFTIY